MFTFGSGGELHRVGSMVSVDGYRSTPLEAFNLGAIPLGLQG